MLPIATFQSEYTSRCPRSRPITARFSCSNTQRREPSSYWNGFSLSRSISTRIGVFAVAQSKNVMLRRPESNHR